MYTKIGSLIRFPDISQILNKISFYYWQKKKFKMNSDKNFPSKGNLQK